MNLPHDPMLDDDDYMIYTLVTRDRLLLLDHDSTVMICEVTL